MASEDKRGYLDQLLVRSLNDVGHSADNETP